MYNKVIHCWWHQAVICREDVKLTNLICDGKITAAGPTYAALLCGKKKKITRGIGSLKLCLV